MDKWTSVKDAMPPIGNERYLVALDEMGKRICGGLDTDAVGTHGEWKRWGPMVTHWMPLPEPPNGEKK